MKESYAEGLATHSGPESYAVRRFSIQSCGGFSRMRVRSLISIGWSHLNRKEFRHDRATPENAGGTAATELCTQHDQGLHPLCSELRPILPCLAGSTGTEAPPAIPTVPR